jgi:hypothetical protein
LWQLADLVFEGAVCRLLKSISSCLPLDSGRHRIIPEYCRAFLDQPGGAASSPVWIAAPICRARSVAVLVLMLGFFCYAAQIAGITYDSDKLQTF